MPIMRKQKTREYTTVDNYFVYDKNCPLDCKGFLLFMISKPDDWKFNYKNFITELNIGEKAVRTIIKKLESLKYLKREQLRDEKGYYEWIYYVYEKPYEIYLKNDIHPYSPEGYMDEGDTDKGNILLNTNNTKDKIDKGPDRSFFVNLLIKRKYIDEGDLYINYYEKLFSELKNDYDFDDLITVTNYVVTHAINNELKDENGEIIKNKYGYFKSSIKDGLERILNNSKELYEDDILDYDWIEHKDEENYEL